MSRVDAVERIVSLVGPSAKLLTVSSGWPSIVQVQTSGGITPVALHGGQFALRSYRGRDDLERRMQNPGQDHPVVRVTNAVPVIVGLWDEEDRPILVAFDAERRVGKATRQSFFGALPHLRVAASQGWTSYKSGSDEEVFAFWPQLLPAYIEMVARGVHLDPDDMAGIVSAAGLADDGKPLPAEERVRRTTTTLVRRAAFSSEVVAAYGTLCAMCGLDFGLVQGAHIYPASAPDSSDDVRNGLALCANHHAAFDRHLVYVDPENRGVRLHPKLVKGAEDSEACRAFIGTTVESLKTPQEARFHPRPEMFRRRYAHFEEAYAWCA